MGEALSSVQGFMSRPPDDGDGEVDEGKVKSDKTKHAAAIAQVSTVTIPP